MKADSIIPAEALAQHSDGSISVLKASTGLDKARSERDFSDANNRDPAQRTLIGRVAVEIIELVAEAAPIAGPDICPGCGLTISPTQTVLWDPVAKVARHPSCGPHHARPVGA